MATTNVGGRGLVNQPPIKFNVPPIPPPGLLLVYFLSLLCTGLPGRTFQLPVLTLLSLLRYEVKFRAQPVPWLSEY